MFIFVKGKFSFLQLQDENPVDFNLVHDCKHLFRLFLDFNLHICIDIRKSEKQKPKLKKKPISVFLRNRNVVF